MIIHKYVQLNNYAYKMFPVGAVQSNGVVIIIRKRPIVNIKKGAFFNPTFISARQDQTNIIFNITICLRYNDIDAPDSLCKFLIVFIMFCSTSNETNILKLWIVKKILKSI
ncbi:hypothetical protein GJ496_002738 [Pomphorhynchus laevis]|nr:hypothetical protein GJ496_002738 [Pomphorhynchus laevis]